MTAVTRPTKMYAASFVMEGTHFAALPKSVHADTPKAGDEAKTAIVANACAVRVMRNLTVKLSGRPPWSDKRRRRILSFSASGAQPQTYHGPLQRWLGRTAPSGAYHAYHDANNRWPECKPK